MLIAGTGAFFICALREPVALPHDATADATIRNASTCLVLAAALFVGLLAAAFDLLRLIRRTLGSLDSVAESAGRVVIGDFSAHAVSRDGCLTDMSRFIENFNTMTIRLKPLTSFNAATAAAGGGNAMHARLAELETRLEEIRGLATEADASSREALLHCVDGLFRFVDDLRVAEQPEAPAIRALPR
ncbi:MULTISPECIES: histidine kinase [Burkholderia]|uniref:histidine kinase n=1 Tax=Burkholderia TaxID=32008 RepID=UPI001FB5353C|nr:MULTISPECIES: histidine kinase [Burkholderia]UOB58541.1 histidine kinase [Burkholderia pyrrocinia]